MCNGGISLIDKEKIKDNNFKHKLIIPFLSIISLSILGTFGYYYLEDGWSLLDAFYMVVISVTTVGFGEVHTLSPHGRIFTIFIIIFGLGLAANFISQFVKFVVEGELGGLFRRNKMNKKIKKIKNHYIVCGHGKSGSTICLKLNELNLKFIVVDIDEKALIAAQQRDFLTVEGNAGSDEVLLSAGIERANGLVISCSNDGTSVLISLAARELNPDIQILALGSYPTNESRTIRAGANTVVYPMRLGGEQIANLIAKEYNIESGISTKIQKTEIYGYSLMEYKHFAKKTCTIASILEKFNAIQAVALKRDDDSMIETPQGNLEMNKGDVVVILINNQKNITRDAIHNFKKINWSEQYRTGISVMDADHRKLIVIINRFSEALSVNSSKVETIKIYESLLNYTVTHFEHEESLMKKYNYPDSENHFQIHKDLVGEVLELKKDKKYIFPENIIDFLNSWLIDHILETDKKLGEFLNKKGVR